MQLEAQIQYRLGNNEEAIRIYSDLFRTHKVEGAISLLSYLPYFAHARQSVLQLRCLPEVRTFPAGSCQVNPMKLQMHVSGRIDLSRTSTLNSKTTHSDRTSGIPQVESLELRTNVVAAYVAGGRSSEAGAVMEAMHSSVADSYELAFNRACALMEEGDYPAAEEQLQLALRTGALVIIETSAV